MAGLLATACDNRALTAGLLGSDNWALMAGLLACDTGALTAGLLGSDDGAIIIRLLARHNRRLMAGLLACDTVDLMAGLLACDARALMALLLATPCLAEGGSNLGLDLLRDPLAVAEDGLAEMPEGGAEPHLVGSAPLREVLLVQLGVEVLWKKKVNSMCLRPGVLSSPQR